VNLVDFAELTAYDFCAMMGFRNGPGAQPFACRHFWTHQERLLMQNFLTIAREQVENVLDYPIYPKFICGERHPWNRVGLIGPLDVGYVQKIGTKTTEEIDEVPTDLTEDIWEFNLTVDFEDACEARLFHTVENGEEEIFPLTKSISGTTLTVRVYKCALVIPDIFIPKEGLDYGLDANFVDEIVVKRVYAQRGTGANFVWKPTSSSCSSCSPCTEQTQLACPTIRDKRPSLVDVRPATFAADEYMGASYSAFANCGHYPNQVEIDYVAYYNEDCDADCGRIPQHLKLAILHVALANMPRQPICACAFHKQMFAEDQEILKPVVITPLGAKFGHVTAMTMLSTSIIGGGGQFVAI
jgi:hypothetical protein